MGAKGEENKPALILSQAWKERCLLYDLASRFGQTPGFAIHKEKFHFNIRLNQTRMKSPLNYPEIRHALELINFSFHFQKPLIITSPGQENHKFQNFQFQKKPASLQWYPFSSLHWGDLEAADAEEGMSWCNCSPQKERICDCVQFASSQGRASSKPHLETGKTLLSLRPL